MDATQLRERLLVAETLMKNLYNRNKELEKTLEEKQHCNEPSTLDAPLTS